MMTRMKKSNIGVSRKGIKTDIPVIYRNVTDLNCKLEEIVNNSSSISDLFNRRSFDCRGRLRDLSESILFRDPSGFGKRAEELFWRRNYHDFMQCYKRFRKDVTPDEVLLLETHFISGIGHYDNLIRRFAVEYGLDLSNVLPDIQNDSKRMEEEDEKQQVLQTEQSSITITAGGTPTAAVDKTEKEIEAAKLCVHRMFLCLGDIFRYLHELGYANNHVLAVKWYNAAFTFIPSIGMPFNQLGTLSSGSNYNLDSTYYYMRCMLSEKPFEGAQGNLTYLFRATSQLAAELQKENKQESLSIVKKCITQFLIVAKELWSSINPNPCLPALIQDCFTSLKEGLTIPPKPSTAHKPAYLDSSTVFKMGVSVLMFICKLETKEIQSSALHSVAVAFGLNFFFLLLTSSATKIKDKVEKSIEDVTIVNTITNGKVKSSSSSQASKENSTDLSPRKTLSRLRRRKAAIKYDDTDADLFDFDDDDSEFSELEETALSTIDALEISSDISEGGSVCDESDFHDHLDSSEEEGSQFTTQNSTTSIVQVEGVLEYVYYETSLSVVKIFCDWLRINPSVMGFCVESFESMFAHLADLLNTLLALESTVTSVNKGLSSLKYTDLNWEQKYPLTVDRALRNFPGLEKYQSQFIDYSAKRNLSSDEMSFLCIQSLIGFGHFIVNNINKPVLKYDAVANRFVASTDKNGTTNTVVTVDREMPVVEDVSRNTKVTSPTSNVNSNGQIGSTCSSPEYLTNENGRQKQMMRNMAHLWLKSEVHKLEKAVKGGKLPQLSPYLVLDSCTYMDHLNLVKDLVFSKRFIIVVPKLVLASLDQKKKASANAREAIRWLEAEAQRGSRFIKFLRENERYSLAPMKYPRRKERDAFNFFMLLEYCNYLHQFNSAQIANNNKKELAMVTLLFSSSSNFPANSDALIRSVGMTMERIDVFVSKWRSSMKAKT